MAGRPLGERRAHEDAFGRTQIEIDPGRAVPNDWNKWLVEPWAERKARRTREKIGMERRA